MAQLVWNAVGQRFHEAGVDRGVLFIDNVGHPWNGLVSVEEAPTGGEARAFYIDGVKYLNVAAKEEFEATISAYYSPVEFDQCEGIGSIAPGFTTSQQRRKSFGLTYRTKIGNDVNGLKHGYKIHIIYNALVAPTTRTYASISDNVEVPVLSWPITTRPIKVPGFNRSAHFVINSTEVTERALNDIETFLYGSETEESTLPTPEQLIAMLTAADVFTVTSLGDGLYEISGSADDVDDAGQDLFVLNNTAVVPIDADTATVSSA